MDLEYYADILKLKRGGDVQPPRSKKYFRTTKSGAGMTAAGVAKYRRDNPGSKLKTAVTGKVKSLWNKWVNWIFKGFYK